ncbi:MAG: hypothetical protein ACUVWP_09475 [bacterium]
MKRLILIISIFSFISIFAETGEILKCSPSEVSVCIYGDGYPVHITLYFTYYGVGDYGTYDAVVGHDKIEDSGLVPKGIYLSLFYPVLRPEYYYEVVLYVNGKEMDTQKSGYSAY